MHTDIVIIGGGLNGLTMAGALAPLGLSVAVIEASDPATLKGAAFDGRTSAIAHTSRNLFKAIGVWQHVEDKAGPIWDIRITDGDSPLFLHFDHKEVGDEAMGHIVENRHLRQALFEKIAEYDNLTLLAPMRYESVEVGNQHAIVTLENGEEIRTKLVIAADGRNSRLREQAGIPTVRANYPQTGIVCTIKHEKPHEGIAQERFLPAGPFAILPMADPYLSSLVWTEKTELAQHFIGMEEKEFTTHLTHRFGDYLGTLKLVGGRWQYPLSLCFAKRYTDQRLALIGDAAHAIHPIAGQGFNLGIRDIAALTELIATQQNVGLDVGSSILLKEYESLRRNDNLLMIAATDSLNHLFSNEVKPVRLARTVGLSAVNKVPPLRQFFIRHAMGFRRNAPELLRDKQ